jgi:hypothetical protein
VTVHGLLHADVAPWECERRSCSYSFGPWQVQKSSSLPVITKTQTRDVRLSTSNRDPATRHLSPALSIPEVCKSLSPVGFAARDIRVLSNHIEFHECHFRSEQIDFFARYADETLRLPATATELSTFFGFCARTVRKTFLRDPGNPYPLGMHNGLDDQSGAEIIALLRESFQQANSIVRKVRLTWRLV